VTIDYRTSEPVDGTELNQLMQDAWPDHALMDPEVLRRCSAGWVCAYDGGQLVGFVNVAWDSATHFFLLDTTSPGRTSAAASAPPSSPPRSSCPSSAAATGCTSTTSRS